jgi:hypothetical protein
MASYIYDTEAEKSSDFFVNRNIVTVALARDGKMLNKTIFGDGRDDIGYGKAYKFKFFSKEIECLDDICQLVRYLLHRPYCCLIRGVAIDDRIDKQRRLLHPDKGDAETIIEQEQNWYALDVDDWGISSGDLRQDAKRVLRALGIPDVQAFAIPSANYLIKKGIRIRLFLWNSAKISCLSLRRHFTSVVDPSLFSPIQPIYVARPTFIGRNDPCSELVVWIPGEQIYTEIQDTNHISDRKYRPKKYTKKQAEAFLRTPRPYPKDVDPRILWEFPETERHPALYRFGRFMGELIAKELLDEEEVVEELLDKATYYWRGNYKNDERTLRDAIRKGKESWENQDEF